MGQRPIQTFRVYERSKSRKKKDRKTAFKWFRLQELLPFGIYFKVETIDYHERQRCSHNSVRQYFNPRTSVDAITVCDGPLHHIYYFDPRTHKYRHDSTFLCCCGLIGSHVVPIAHSVLSGLDNGPLMKRERSRV